MYNCRTCLCYGQNLRIGLTLFLAQVLSSNWAKSEIRFSSVGWNRREDLQLHGSTDKRYLRLQEASICSTRMDFLKPNQTYREDMFWTLKILWSEAKSELQYRRSQLVTLRQQWASSLPWDCFIVTNPLHRLGDWRVKSEEWRPSSCSGKKKTQDPP